MFLLVTFFTCYFLIGFAVAIVARLVFGENEDENDPSYAGITIMWPFVIAFAAIIGAGALIEILVDRIATKIESFKD